MIMRCLTDAHDADVELVAQNAFFAGRVAAQGGPIPSTSIWRRDSVGIQSGGDDGGRAAGSKLLVDTRDNPGLLRIDLAVGTVFAVTLAIAEGF